MPTPQRYPNAAARQAAYRLRQAEARSQEQAGKRMPALPAVATLPGDARWHALMEQAGRLLDTVQHEMEGYYDQRSAAWQDSERGEAFLERLDAVRAAQSAVAEVPS